MNTFVIQSVLTESIASQFSGYPIVKLVITCFIAMLVAKLFQGDVYSIVEQINEYFVKEYIVTIKYEEVRMYNHHEPSFNTPIENETMIKAIERYVGRYTNMQKGEIKLIRHDKPTDNDYDKNSKVQIKYIATVKTPVPGYDNIWFCNTSNQEKTTLSSIGPHHPTTDSSIKMAVTMYSTVSTEYINSFIKRCYDDYIEEFYGDEKGKLQRYVFINCDGQDNNKMNNNFFKFNSTVTFDDIFFEGKEHMINTVKEFLAGRTKNNKLTILLYGPPGTGKTSIIKAICNMAERSAQYIKLNNIKDYSKLMKYVMLEDMHNIDDSIIYTIPLNKKVVVFEDLDRDCTVATDKEKHDDPDILENFSMLSEQIDKINTGNNGSTIKKKKEGITQSDLYNLFDGVVELKEGIVIITTNNIDKLSPGLIRPGRVNLKMFIGNITYNNAILLVQKLYRKNDFTVDELAIIRRFIDKEVTPSEIERLCIAYPSIDQWKS